MRRELVPVLILALLLGLFAGYAWLTRHPRAPILERAQEWPVVGPLATRFRDAYLPGGRTAGPAPREPYRSVGEGVVAEDEPGVESLGPDPTARESPLTIWVRQGTPLRTGPSEDSAVLAVTEELASLPYDRKAGDWYRVRLGDVEGWAFLAGKRLAWMTGGRDRNGAPIEVRSGVVLPLPSRPPDPEWLAAGMAILGEDAVETTAGPYRLYTDVRWQKLLDRIEVTAGQLESLYRERYSLEPREGSLEVILLFARKEDYEAFSRQEDRLRGIDAAAHVGRGVVALYAEGRSRGAVVSSLLHELTHLLNRRALGPALPPWLGEGLADDLSMSRIEADGRIRPGTLGGDEERTGRQVLRHGGRAAALLLREAADRGELPALEEIVRLDWPAFVQVEVAPLHYAQSAFFLRFLLSDWLPGTRAGFLGFLAATAAGSPISEEGLLEYLGRSWPELNEGFRIWLRLQFLPPTDETVRPLGT